MKGKRVSGLIILGILAIMSIPLLLEEIMFSTTNPTVEILANNTYEETLIVGTGIDYPPYAFQDENGEITGYYIELVNAIANRIEMNVEIKVLDWPKPLEALAHHQVDLVPGMEYREEYYEPFILSTPLIADQFVLYGMTSYDGINNLVNKRIGTIQYSPANQLVLEPLGIYETTIEYPTYLDAIQGVLDGEIDYFIGKYSVGQRTLATNDIHDIRAVGDVMGNTAFSLGMAADNHTLEQKVNQAIEQLNRVGVLDALRDKWLGTYINVLSLGDYIQRYYKEVMVAAVLLSTLAVQVIIYKRKKALDHMMEVNQELLRVAEYKQIIVDATAGLYETIYEYDITNNRISNIETQEVIVQEGLSAQMSYDELMKTQAMKCVEESFRESFFQTFHSETVLKLFAQGTKYFEFEYERLGKDERYIWVRDSARIFYWNRSKSVYMILYRQNIDTPKRKELELMKRAECDLATGLYNKQTAELLIKEFLASEKCRGVHNALLIIDIDDFKLVNDQYGHSIGDECIVYVAQQLTEVFGSESIIGRIGGDEFIVLLKTFDTIQEVYAKIEVLFNNMQAITLNNETVIAIGLSIGITLADEKSEFIDLYNQADKALYKIKEEGKKGFEVYNKKC